MALLLPAFGVILDDELIFFTHQVYLFISCSGATELKLSNWNASAHNTPEDYMAEFLGVDGKWHPEGYFYGVDGKYHPPTVHYAPGTNKEGEPHIYRPSNQLYGIEDGRYHNAGSFPGVDGERHQSGYFYGIDGKYHPEGSVYGLDGQYHEPPQKR